MRILYVHPKGELGGSDVSLLTMLKAIDKKKFSSHVIVAKKGPLYSDYEKYSVKCEKVSFNVTKKPDNVIEFLKTIFWFIPSIFLILYKIKKWKIDLIHINSIVVPSAVIAGKLSKKPVIVHKREIIVSNKLSASILDWITSLFADKVIAISNAVKFSSSKILQKKTVVIYNGVELNDRKRSENLRDLYKIQKNTLLVGIFSRIEPWKGQHVVINALPTVVSKVKNVKVLIFGEAYTKSGRHYMKTLKDLVKSLDLEDVVLFKEPTKDLKSFYKDFDLILLPSIEPEPLGRVAIEGMAAGKPVITTDKGGSKECVINGKTGLVVKSNDTKSMGLAMIKILRDRKLRETLGHNGRKRAKEIFDIKKSVESVENLYQLFRN